MIKIIIIFFILIFANISNASTKKNIINNFKKINNLSFNFIQTIDGKDEKGDCIINYPKKIYCSYKFKYKKVLVSNGKSLVIKSNKNKQYYRYKLKSTLLNIILDKDYLISKMQNTEGNLINEKYYNFKIKNELGEINIYFDNNNYTLIGWQVEDLYQNLTVTFVYNIKTNQKIDNDLFKLPELF